MPVAKKVYRCVFWGAFAVYSVFAILILGVRYWALPNVEQWRPQIEAYASQALGARVTIAGIDANWRGLHPQLKLKTLAVYNQENEPVLTLPSVDAVLAWRSVLTFTPRLSRLRIDNATLTLRRDIDNYLWVAGRKIDLNPQSANDKAASPGLQWLLGQRELILSNSTIHWQDDKRQAPEIILQSFNFHLYNGALSHRFSLHAKPPPELAAFLDVRAELKRSFFSGSSDDFSNLNGQFYAEIGKSEPHALSPWLAVPEALSGRIAARAWWDLEEGQWGKLTLDTAIQDAAWQAPDQALAVSVQSAQFRLQGMPGDLLQRDGMPLAHTEKGTGVALSGNVSGARVRAPAVFASEIAIDVIALDASLSQPLLQPLMLELRKLDLSNNDLAAHIQGRWVDQGSTPAGRLDMEGQLERASMSAIHRYLPLTVNEDAREWLAKGLPAGAVSKAAFEIKGDIDNFPFEHPRGEDNFQISGRYHDAIVDYAPARATTKPWPKLEKLSGEFSIHNVSLELSSQGGAVFHSDSAEQIMLGAVGASIPNLENNAELFVTGQTSGSVAAYLAMAAQSPLGGMLDGALDHAQGSGDWQLGLHLRVPLLDADKTTVNGRIHFADNAFSFMPEMPLMSQLNGDLDFSDVGVHIPRMQGHFLGGPMQIRGQLAKGADALQFDGELTGQGLSQLSNVKAMGRFSGKTAYRGRLSYQKGGAVDISVESNLQGMAIDFPAPLGKKTQAAQALRLQWAAASDRSLANTRWLTGSVGDTLNILLERNPADAKGTFFTRGAVGLNRAATLPQNGLSVSINVPELDVDAWRNVSAEFSAPASKSAVAGRNRQELLPAPNLINVVTQRLLVDSRVLDDLKLYAVQAAPSQWRVDIDSLQIAGSLDWREASGSLPAQVTARLKHLVLNSSNDNKDKDKDSSLDKDFSAMPTVDLQVQDFTLFGKALGALQLQGQMQDAGKVWRLGKLQISNDAMTLHMNGLWRLQGPERGLGVSASITFTDFGKSLARIGFADTVQAGSGSLQAKLDWNNFPWKQNIADISGQVQTSLDKGRFVHVNSRAARLLELLSLQSLSRLAKLDFNPTSLLREGFPFDTIRGDVTVKNGVMLADGYKVNGPVAIIVLAGNTNLVKETWDMQAVVIPNLDASGAAVVTALAVNPLIGLGAFVTQWLLKQPLAHAMTTEYRVTGSWDDPKIETISAAKKDSAAVQP